MTATLDFVLCLLGARLSCRMVVVIRCPSPKLRKTLNLARVTMLPASLHAIHYKHILNFGEGQVVSRALHNVYARLVDWVAWSGIPMSM
jgi:hypothetical protein